MKTKSTFDADKEMAFLNRLVPGYADQEPYSKIKKDIILGLIDKVIHDGPKKSGMQMGCANGYETKQLAQRLKSLTVVDGASQFVAKLSKNNRNTHIRFVCSLFEEMHRIKEFHKRFDYVFCNYVLEHVVDVQTVLREIKKLLRQKGKLFVVVPNREALSRQIAFEMGLVSNLSALTDNDHKHGHRRTFTQVSLLRELRRAGFKVDYSCGIVLKILADFQLNELLKKKTITTEHFSALQALAQKGCLGKFSDSIFVTASR